jgi:hypothetical protein
MMYRPVGNCPQALLGMLVSVLWITRLKGAVPPVEAGVTKPSIAAGELAASTVNPVKFR